SLEVRRTFLEKGLNAFSGVFGLQGFEKGSGLDLDRLVDGCVNAVVHRLDHEPRRDRWPLRELACQRLGIVERLAVLRQAIDEPGAVALRGRDLRTQDQVLERDATADQPRKALSPSVARGDTEIRLRLPHARGLFQDSDVTSHRDLAAAAERVPVDGRDDWL